MRISDNDTGAAAIPGRQTENALNEKASVRFRVSTKKEGMVMRQGFVSAFIASVIFVAACMSPQKPYHIAVTQEEDVVAIVTRTLAAEGHAPTAVDANLGLVQTKWEDTGFLYGQVQGVNATIVRRFSATIAKTPGGATVDLRMDSQKCQQGGYTIGDVDVRGACEALDGVIEKHQRELDALGAKMAQALGGTGHVVGMATAYPREN